MTNEYTGGATPEIENVAEVTDGRYNWFNMTDQFVKEDLDEAEYVQVDYPTRPYGDVNKDAWNDCVYCGGSPAIFCQFNHVEARPMGDARRVNRSRESYVTVVADCKENVPVFLTPTQRYTSYKPTQGMFLRKGV